MDITRKWLEGIKLAEAWFQLGRPEFQDEYRNAGRNPQRTAYFRTLMQDELVAGLREGRLLSAGVKIEPKPSDGPEPIDAFMFSEPEIDWDNSTLRGFGRSYESVRIVELSRTESHEDQLPLAPKRMGRPPIDEQLRPIVAELESRGRLSGISRKEQESRVRELARQRHPDLFIRPSQPSRTKILEAIRALGNKEEASTIRSKSTKST